MQLTVGQIIGKALKAYGVPYVTGLPGHGNWSMIDAFNDPVSKLPFIQVMHEQSAVHIADAHYRDVHCALFVHHLNERQLGHRIVESVDHAPISVPRQASNIRHAVRFESLSDDLSYGELHGHPPRSNPVAPHILLPVGGGKRMNLAATTLPKFNEPQKDTKFTKEANPDRLPFVALGDLSGFMFASRPQYAWLYNP